MNTVWETHLIEGEEVVIDGFSGRENEGIHRVEQRFRLELINRYHI